MSETIELPDDGAERKEQVKRQALVSLIESNPLRYGWLRECISDTPASPPDELAALKAKLDALREYYEYTAEHATMPRGTLTRLEAIVANIVNLGAHKP